ncbi:MAG: hypothetical protein Q4C61_03975 [Lachnospiraceae bacterium]|nr:hypothetical protein [Lachnospiraceae bacterium]
MDRKKKQKYRAPEMTSLMRELRGYEREGMHLYLDGRPSGANEIANACVFAEHSDYMRDIISDEKDHITEIRFIRISEENY